jgi:hypothetical protein
MISPMTQKFIITQDEQTAQMLLTSNFKLVHQVGTTYTFLNDMSQHSSFANFDKTKIVYTNRLNF